MRLFVAIPLPEDARNRLEEFQQDLEGVRWQRSDQLHITLRFIGDVDDEKVHTIQNRLKLVSRPSFRLFLKAPGYFPENRHPRVLWVGVDKSPPLTALQQDVEQACRQAGLEPENRKFKPHITLGKVKGASMADVASFMDRHNEFGIDIPVTEFVLYSSELRHTGAIHRPQERYPLK